MQIGELATRAGVSARALRYYEQQGLLAPDRDDNGYRDYDEHALTVVRNIQNLLADGLLIKDVHKLQHCLSHHDLAVEPLCDEAAAAYAQRHQATRQRLDELADQHRRLTAVLDHDGAPADLLKTHPRPA